MNFKILIVGLDNVGKTSFVEKLNTGIFNPNIHRKYDSTILEFVTTKGPLFLEFKTSNTYEDGHDAEIIMHDLSDPRSRLIIDTIPKANKPRIVVGNKSDLRDIPLSTGWSIRQDGNTYINISLKSNQFCENALIHLLRKLISNDLRILFEPNEETRIDSKILKQLCGGDTMLMSES